MELKLKGWPAIFVLLAIAAVFVGKIVMERSTLATEAAEELKVYLRGEYASMMLHGVNAEQLTDDQLEATGEQLLKLEDIRFIDIRAKGRGDDVVVRVEIEVGGEDPPDGKQVRYYNMERSAITRWRVLHQTTALSYYFKIL
jgi:hypothetical protein